jgi:hypothetical protein
MTALGDYNRAVARGEAVNFVHQSRVDKAAARSRARMKRRLHKIFFKDAGAFDDDDDDGDNNDTGFNTVEQLAERIASSTEGEISYAEALDWLRERNSLAPPAAKRQTKKEIPMSTKIDASGVTETVFVEAVTKHAQSLYPDLAHAPDRAFARLFAADVTVRKAHAAIKNAQLAKSLMPTMPVSADVGHSDEPEDWKKAYDQLTEMADRMRAASPELKLSKAQAFARAFDANPDLARIAHQRPKPTTIYEFPR